LQTFARVVNQQGINFLVGTGGRTHLEGDLAYLKMREGSRDARPGANLKFVLPVSEHVAFALGGSYNPTLISAAGSGELTVGLLVGNFIRPGDFRGMTSPVPMDVPRVRYEFGTRRVGSSPPIADAGPNQLGVAAGTVTLNGCASYDPLNLPLTYQWTQISGPNVAISNANACSATFTAAAGQTYSFRLMVRNTDNLQGTATTTVSTTTPAATRIVQFTAAPATIQSGQSSTLSWVIENATSATITPGVGTVDPRTGSTSVSPTANTTYTLTATGPNGSTTSTVTVTLAA